MPWHGAPFVKESIEVLGPVMSANDIVEASSSWWTRDAGHPARLQRLAGQVSSSEEQQWLRTGQGAQVLNSAYADLVISGIVHGLDLAINPR